MSSAWLLPEHLADVLPAEARRLEELRRLLLDMARSYGFEQVMPPMLEHLESLLSGTGSALDLRTFKLVDQLSGRTLGLRADATPQVARIDAHLLNREGVVRLCYCGPVLHTRPSSAQATREPLQFGAELYGHAGLEADLEVQDLALAGLQAAGCQQLLLDLADARLLRGLLADVALEARSLQALADALATKNSPWLRQLGEALPAAVRDDLLALTQLYGDVDAVLAAARQRWAQRAPLQAALDDLERLARHAQQAHPEVAVGLDLADVGGNSYYSGPRFAVYAQGAADAVLRGGRYDEVGAVFGRSRPAVGFSIDLKALTAHVPAAAAAHAVRAPWSADPQLRAAVRELRAQGHVVLCGLPGHTQQTDEFLCDRELVLANGRWQLQPLTRGG